MKYAPGRLCCNIYCIEEKKEKKKKKEEKNRKHFISDSHIYL